MAGKRHSGSMDPKMYNKVPRVETALQHSIPCTGKTIPKDMQVCKNFLTYPVSSTEGQHALNPWNSTTAYLQYAGNALNQHLHSGGVSRCQRPENERMNSSFHLSNNNSHFSAPQHPVHNYHISPSGAYPPFAVPRPVYKGPNSFIDPTYQTQNFQSMGVHVGSQPVCQPTMEWGSSTRFPYPSSPLYMSGMKNLYPAHNGYLEADGNPSSQPRSVQELGPVYRHRTDINTSVGRSPTSYQENVFTDHLQPYAQQNMQMLCAEGSGHVGKPSSAYTGHSNEHYKFIYHGSPDTRMGHMYSKAYYNSAIDGYQQRSALYSCGVDKSLSSLNIKGFTSYGKVQKPHSGYVNPELKARTQYDDHTQTSQAKAELSRTSREPQMCPGQRDKASLFGSGPVNTDFCVNSANMDKELGSAHGSNDLHESGLYEKCVTEQRLHGSFIQQNNSSKILPDVPMKSIVANGPGKESTLPTKLSSSPSPLHTADDRRISNTTFDKQTANTAHANATIPNSSESIHHPKMSDDNQTSPKAEAMQSSFPQVSKADAIDPTSPPMPVINDVFSLAPYRAYLEGKAPHPFPVQQESKMENNKPTSVSSQQSFKENVEKVEKDAFKPGTISTVVNKESHDSENMRQRANTQTSQFQDAYSSNSTMDPEVLDLSLKRSAQTSSSMQDQVNVSHHSHKPCTELVSEINFSQDSETLSVKTKENCLSQVPRVLSHSEKDLHMSHTSVITCSFSTEHNLTTEKNPCLTQETRNTAKSSICQSQNSCPSQAPETLSQELQTSYLCETQSDNSAKHSLHANNGLSPHKDYAFQANKSQPLYSDLKCRSQLPKMLSQQLEENCTSQALKNIIPQARNNCLSQASKSKPNQFLDGYQSHAAKYLSLQAAESQPHNVQENDTSQTPQLQQNCASQTTETAPHHKNDSSVPETYSLHSSAQPANLCFVNAVQTPTSFFSQTVFYSSPAAVSSPKNLNLPSQQHQNQPPGPTEKIARKSEPCRTSFSGSENEGTGFHSSKAFMIRKYKMMKFSTSGPEVQEANSSSHSLPRLFLLPSDAAQLLPPSAPESSPTLGEANVSLASTGGLAPNGSGQQFSELHRLVRAAITSSVARSPSNLLEDWLEKTKDAERNKIPTKAKSGSRPNDTLPESPGHDIWQEFDGVRLCLYKLLSQLETFMFTRCCPFPHVIRAGAIFIPIHLVKEVLFPELGTSVDRILQKHKVELRPTTLSEEKLLRETELKDCPSRMLKLLALKQLPDVYPDLLHLFCEHTIQNHLDSCSTKDLGKLECPSRKPSNKSDAASPKKGKTGLVKRIQRVCKSPGTSMYKFMKLRPLKKSSKEKLQTTKVFYTKTCKDRTEITYKMRNRTKCGKSKRFPDLVGKRIMHLFDDGERETWFPGLVLRVHRRSRRPQDTQYEVWYDAEPGIRYYLELLQDYEKGWLKLDS